MKQLLVHLLVFSYIIVFATETSIFAAQKPKKQRQRPEFRPNIKKIMDTLARQNGWDWDKTRNYDKAHIVPWQEMKKQVEAYGTSSGYDDLQMKKFVKLHGDAAYYANLDDSTKKKYNDLISKYQKDSLNLLKEAKSGEKTKLLKTLFNSPGNLRPGNFKSNSGISNRLDPPLKYRTDSKGKILRDKEGKVLRSNKMTEHAKKMLKDYKLVAYEAKNKKGVKRKWETTKATDKKDKKRKWETTKATDKKDKKRQKIPDKPSVYTSDVKGNVKTRKNQVNPKTICSKRKRRSITGCGINILEDTKTKKTNAKTKTIDSRRKRTNTVRRIGVTKENVARSKRRKVSIGLGPKITKPSPSKTLSRNKGKKGGRGKGIKSGMIDLTGGWIPKHHKSSATGQKIKAESGLSIKNGRVLKWAASSGGYKGEAKHGYSEASGTAHVGFEAYSGTEGTHVKVDAPSGQLSSHGIGVGGDLSVRVGISHKDNEFKVGIEGPGVSGNVGPIGAGFGIGVGAEASLNFKKGAGAKVDTPTGSFGAKVGCITEVCFFGCITVKVC